MNRENDYVLDEEERDILEKFNKDELRSPTDAAQEMELAVEAARNTTREWRQVTLQVTEEEYSLVRARAAEEGIPCPSLLSGIIHKYLSGRLIEKGR